MDGGPAAAAVALAAAVDGRRLRWGFGPVEGVAMKAGDDGRPWAWEVALLYAVIGTAVAVALAAWCAWWETSAHAQEPAEWRRGWAAAGRRRPDRWSGRCRE